MKAGAAGERSARILHSHFYPYGRPAPLFPPPPIRKAHSFTYLRSSDATIFSRSSSAVVPEFVEGSRCRTGSSKAVFCTRPGTTSRNFCDLSSSSRIGDFPLSLLTFHLPLSPFTFQFSPFNLRPFDRLRDRRLFTLRPFDKLRDRKLFTFHFSLPTLRPFDRLRDRRLSPFTCDPSTC